jgi:hypothetical protein
MTKTTLPFVTAEQSPRARWNTAWNIPPTLPQVHRTFEGSIVYRGAFLITLSTEHQMEECPRLRGRTSSWTTNM